MSIVLQKSVNRVREAGTFAQGHTAGQCPRPIWDQGCLTRKLSCGGGGGEDQGFRGRGGFRDDEDQGLGLVAGVKARAQKWMRPEAWLSGSSGPPPAGQQVCSEWPLFTPGQEECSLRRRAWSGRQGAEGVQPAFLGSFKHKVPVWCGPGFQKQEECLEVGERSTF